jgi:hypothetical protein
MDDIIGAAAPAPQVSRQNFAGGNANMCDMQAKRGGTPLPPPTHNTPGLPALTEQERVYCEGAREALASIRKTFDFWVAIGRGLKALHDKAQAIGGKKTYDRLRQREGLGKDVINKTRSSRLLAIIDRLTEVGAWRDGLTEKQRFTWASPEAIHRHCSVFHKSKPATKPTPSKPAASTKPLTVDQDFAVLIELLQDEPESVVHCPPAAAGTTASRTLLPDGVGGASP